MKDRFWLSIDRFWLHVPHGLLLVFMAWLSGWLCAVYAAFFLAYELDECKHLRDQAWRDIAGAMAGMVLGSLALAVILRRPL